MRLWNIVRARLRALFRREQVLSDIDEELRHHLEMATEENLRGGMTPEQARQGALRDFGNVGQFRDQAYDIRGGGLLEALWQDLRFAVRMLRKHPILTFSAVATMALGMGATSAVFSVVHPLLIRGLPFRDPDRLLSIRETCLPKFSSFSVAPGNFLAWRERGDVFEGMAAFENMTLSLTGAGEPERLRALRVTSGFFELFGVAPHLGRTFFAPEDVPGREQVVVLAGGFFERRFGGVPDVLGRTLMLDGKPHLVVGVMPSGLHPTMGDVDVWIPAAFSAAERQRHGSHYMHVIGRLRAGATIDTARARLNETAQILEREHPEENGGWRVKIDPLEEDVVGGVRPALVLLSAAVAFVLLIACANVASLLLSRATSREREIAVRVALGAGRWRILRQLASESVLLSVLGGAAGLALGVWGVDLLLALAPEGLAGLKAIKVDPALLAFAFSASLLTGIVVAMPPALHAFRVDVGAVLKEGGHGGSDGRGRARVRRTLIVVEIASCAMLLMCAGLLIRSLNRVLAVDPGFQTENVLTLEIDLPDRKYSDPVSRQSYFERAVEAVSSLPGVRAAAAAQTIPFAIDWMFSFEIDGRPPDPPGKEPSANYYAVTPDYFRAMSIRLVRGRLFTRQDAADSAPVAIINEKLARQFFPDGDALGKLISVRPAHKQQIVGIVGDVKQYGLAGPVYYQLYEPFAQKAFGSMTLVVRSERDSQGLGRAIHARLATLDADQPLGAIKPLERIVADSVSRRRFTVVLLSIFAAIALLLAMVGIYGVISDAVTQRTREIGIRMALGAHSSDCIRLMMSQGLLPALAGLMLGVLGTLAVARVMAGLLYRVGARDPATLVIGSLVIVAVALVASYVPARRAARVDPMAVLRAE